jgi:predicted RNA-binding Zn ribbon-like protein
MTSTGPDEDLLLDLLNTTPVVDGVPRDLLGDLTEAEGWLRERGGTASAEEWQAVREARAALQAVVRGDATPTSLRPALEGVSYVPALDDQGIGWTLDAPPARRLAVRAVLAWNAVESERPGRLKPCANDECRLFLLDRSKAGGARWCSMAVCGNRMKGRRHYQRARDASSGGS